MARKAARMEMNMAALTEVQRALAYGLLEFGKAIAAEAAARVEYATDPLHIREQWGVAVYFAGKKVADATADGTAAAKPRQFRPGKETAAGIVGFGFPARFHEVGTARTPAAPFLAPASASVANRADELVAAGARPHWPRPG